MAAYTLDSAGKIAAAFNSFYTGASKLDEINVTEGAFGGKYESISKRAGGLAGYNEATGRLTGRLGSKMSLMDSLASASETLRESMASLGESGIDTKDFVAKHTKDLQRDGDRISRELRNAVKEHSKAMVAITEKGQPALIKKFVKDAVKKNFEAIEKGMAKEVKDFQAALATAKGVYPVTFTGYDGKTSLTINDVSELTERHAEWTSNFDKKIADFTDHLTEQFDKRLKFHKESLNEINEFVGNMKEKGIDIKLDVKAEADAAKSIEQKLAEAKPGMKDEMVAKAEAELPKGPNMLVETGKGAVAAALLYDAMTNEDRSGAMKAGEITLGALLGGHTVYKLLNRVSQTAVQGLKV